MTTQEEFFQAHAVDGVLSDEKMGELLTLPSQADSGASPQPSEADAGSKAAADATAAQAKNAGGNEGGADSKPDGKGGAVDESQLNADNAVILARDGKHTISFDKLEEARERARVAEEAAATDRAEAARLRSELEAAQKAKPAQGAAGGEGGEGGDGKGEGGEAGKPGALAGVDFGDYSDVAIAKAVDALVDRRVAGIKAELLAPQAEAAEKTAIEAHYAPIYTTHPDADSIAESSEFKAWKEAQPTLMRKGIEVAMTDGSPQDVIDVFSAYKQATGKAGGADADAGKGKPDAQADAKTLAAAEKAIAEAKTRAPTSLSEIPAGTNAHHDEADAVLARSSTQLMTQFEGKSPDEIMKLMDRTL